MYSILKMKSPSVSKEDPQNLQNYIVFYTYSKTNIDDFVQAIVYHNDDQHNYKMTRLLKYVAKNTKIDIKTITDLSLAQLCVVIRDQIIYANGKDDSQIIENFNQEFCY